VLTVSNRPLTAPPPEPFPVEIAGRRCDLPNGWIVECWVPDGGGNATVGAPDGGGLDLAWPATATRVRLGLPLDVGGLSGNARDYLARLDVAFSEPAGAEAIEWIAILEVEAGGSTRFFLKIEEGVRDGGQIEREARLRRFDPDRQYRLAIQFRPAAKRASIRGLDFAAVLAPDHAPVRRRPKAVVISWDLGHNCVGRAFLVADVLAADYDVEILGPHFERFGNELWGPLRGTRIPIRGFPGGDTAAFLARAMVEIAKVRPEVVVVCKPRLPGVVLGLLARHRFGCPVVLDIDDHELAFVGGGEPLALSAIPADAPDLSIPFEATWTQVCETLVDQFDAVTVSNVALQRRFGGTIVRHARDEEAFARATGRRDELRARHGYGPGDRVVLFLGTPRAHKGVVEVAEAIAEVGDPRLVLCIIGAGAGDRRIVEECRSRGGRVDAFPPRPFTELPGLVATADAVCLIQDPASPIAHYQIPAKLSDALAAGVPVAINDVEPLADLPDSAVTRIGGREDLCRFLRAVAAGRAPGDAAARRAYFLSEFGYAANRARLEAVFERARSTPRGWPEGGAALLRTLADRFAVPLPTGRPTWLPDPVVAPAVLRARPIDIAYFWKQNDTGIYGRRHDMLLRYLARHERVGRIVQFDAPVSGRSIESRVDPERGVADQANLTVVNTIGRFLRTQDGADVLRRVFVHRGGQPNQRLFGVELPPAEDYPDFVRATLREAGVAGRAVAMVAPVVADYPRLHDEVGFPLAAADLIDDHRAMVAEADRQRIEAAYAETLRRADVVFANCEAQRERFTALRSDIVVVRNAGENLYPGLEPRGRELARLRGPILGYVGNLRSRIDVDLLDDLAVRRPGWQIVLIGSPHGDAGVLRLKARANVHFLGVRRYEEAVGYMRMFDVAIMPHLDNDLSRSMSPLKLYVYLSVGLPVVTTPVANIDEVADDVVVASGADGFVTAIERELARPRPEPARIPRRLTWENRVETIVDTLEARMAG